MSDANEFVFKRKRKRSRPCAVTAVCSGQASDGPHPGLIPEIAVHSEQETSSLALPDNPSPPGPGPGKYSQSVVTVENFLRSVQSIARTKQAISRAVPLKKSRAYSRHRLADRGTKAVRRVIETPRRAKEPSRIARSLFRAAVLSGGDPLNTLGDSAGISHTRRPLKFVPLDKSMRPPELGKMPAVEPSNLDHGEGAVLHKRHHGNPSDPSMHHQSPIRIARTPLRLVPLREAEAAYSVMFP